MTECRLWDIVQWNALCVIKVCHMCYMKLGISNDIYLLAVLDSDWNYLNDWLFQSYSSILPWTLKFPLGEFFLAGNLWARSYRFQPVTSTLTRPCVSYQFAVTVTEELCCLMLVIEFFLAFFIVVWPTTSCFADWSKRRHVNFSIIDSSTLHDSLSSDIFTLRENVGWSDSLDGVSIYSNADVVCYSATCRTGLNERNSVRQIVDRSYK